MSTAIPKYEVNTYSHLCSLQSSKHTGYPKTTNATDNNKHSWNKQVEIVCKYLSGNNLPRLSLIRGKLFQVFTPYDCLWIALAFVVLSRWLSLGNRCVEDCCTMNDSSLWFSYFSCYSICFRFSAKGLESLFRLTLNLWCIHLCSLDWSHFCGTKLICTWWHVNTNNNFLNLNWWYLIRQVTSVQWFLTAVQWGNTSDLDLYKRLNWN